MTQNNVLNAKIFQDIINQMTLSNVHKLVLQVTMGITFTRYVYQ